MKRLLWCGLISMGVFCMMADTALSCSCKEPPSPHVALRTSAAVFAGRVISITEFPIYETQSKTYKRSMKKVMFEVTRTWKGSPKPTLPIITGNGGGDCGYKFTIGRSYLVYAQPSYGTRPLSTGNCMRTAELIKAQQDLTALGPGKPLSQKKRKRK